MSETPETKQPTPKRRWRPRFSLLTLMLGVLFVGACGGLWWRWEPWVCDLALRHDETIQNAIFSKDGRQVITVNSYANTVYVWNLETGQQCAMQKTGDADPWSTNYSWHNLSWSRHTADDGFWLVDEETGLPTLRLTAGLDDVWRAAISRSRQRVATVNGRCEARVWDGNEGRQLAVLKGYGNVVLSVTFSPLDDYLLVVVDSDKTARVWSRRRPEYWWGIAWLPEFWIALLSGGALLAIAARHLRTRKVGALPIGKAFFTSDFASKESLTSAPH